MAGRTAGRYDGVLTLLQQEALWRPTRENVWKHAGQFAGPLGPGRAKYNRIPVSQSSPIPRTLCSPGGGGGGHKRWQVTANETLLSTAAGYIANDTTQRLSQHLSSK